MTEPSYKPAMIKRLVPVKDATGATVSWEWVLVEGRELDLSSAPPLKDGDSLLISEFYQID